MSTHEFNTNNAFTSRRRLNALFTLSRVFNEITRRKSATVALLFIFCIIFWAIFADFISPYDPNIQDLTKRKQGPSLEHPMGLDEFGRDLLSRIIHGARVSLTVGLGVVLVALVIGTMLGSIAGYYGGKVDMVVLILADIFLAFPGLIFALGLLVVLGQNLTNVIVALALVNWPGYMRVVRGQVLALKELTFVEAAKIMGAAGRTVMWSHILPNTFHSLIVLATIGVGWAILSEAGLSFLGLGVKPPTPSWGAMISSGRNFLLDAPHIATIPGLILTITILSFNILGDTLRDILDPRMKT